MFLQVFRVSLVDGRDGGLAAYEDPRVPSIDKAEVHHGVLESVPASNDTWLMHDYVAFGRTGFLIVTDEVAPTYVKSCSRKVITQEVQDACGQSKPSHES